MTGDEEPELVGLASRLKQATRSAGGRKPAAEMAGVSVAQWDRYLAGGASPPFLTIVRFALQAGLSVQWLATGEGSMKGPPSAVDRELLARIVTLVEIEAVRRGSRPPPEKYGGLIAHVYAILSRVAAEERQAGSAEVVREVLRLVS